MFWRSRHAVLLVTSLAYLVCYLDRMAMATALPFIATEFDLAPLAMGGVLSAFFGAYALMQFPGGMLADRFGGRRMMVVSLLGWSLFSALTGVARTLVSLLGIRILFGLSEGPFPASAAKTIAEQFPPDEAARANGLQLAAINVGAALAPALMAPLIGAYGWRAAFFTLSLPGVALAIAVAAVLRERTPTQQSRAASPGTSGYLAALPGLLRMSALRACYVTLFLGNLAGWGLLSWLPTYLLKARGMGLRELGFLAPLPYLAGAVGYAAGGYMSDRWFQERREIPIAAGLVLGALMTAAAAASNSAVGAVAWLALAFLFLFVSSAGLFTVPILLVPPDRVGAAFGALNSIGQLAAFLSPLAIGEALDVTQSHFEGVLYGVVGLYLLAAVSASRIRLAAASRAEASHV